MDYYELALYNHILSTQNPETGGLVYFTQMRPGHYRVYSQPHTSMWCCVGSGIENHSKYGEMIYAHTDKDLYVNLFIPSQVEWKDKGITLVQENNFPDEPKTRFTVNTKKKQNFALQVRYPDWVADGALKITVNGKDFPVKNTDGYAAVNRKWKNGDKVEVSLPMTLHAVQMPDKSDYFAFAYGPIVLAAKTSAEDQYGLFADDSRGGHIAHGKRVPLKDAPIVVGDPDKLATQLTAVAGKPLTFNLNGLYTADQSINKMELIPFFRLHESRYIIYFPQATVSGLAQMKQRIAAEENERMALDNKTVDKVVCGEQQPESDHFIKQKDSRTGYVGDVHWREGRRGWFSYEMRNNDLAARQLYIKYFDFDRERNFDVIINDVVVTSFFLKGDKGNDELQVSIIHIPEELLNAKDMTITIKAHEERYSGKIAEIRLLK